MTDRLVMTFRTTGPGGVPGMLRSQAAVSDTVSVPAEMALKIARQIEAGEALADASRTALQAADMAINAADALRVRHAELAGRVGFMVGCLVGFLVGVGAAVLA